MSLDYHCIRCQNRKWMSCDIISNYIWHLWAAATISTREHPLSMTTDQTARTQCSSNNFRAVVVSKAKLYSSNTARYTPAVRKLIFSKAIPQKEIVTQHVKCTSARANNQSSWGCNRSSPLGVYKQWWKNKLATTLKTNSKCQFSAPTT